MAAPALYIFFGLIASGKSTLAALFAKTHDYPYYNTDRVRKELAGLAANARRPDGMGQGIYTPEFTAKTYQALLDRAERDVEQGCSAVVLDGSYSKRSDRKKVLDLARSLAAEPLFILCTCSDEEVRRRLALRAQDKEAVSDGRWDIFVQQKKNFQLPDDLEPEQIFHIETNEVPEQLMASLERFLSSRY